MSLSDKKSYALRLSDIAEDLQRSLPPIKDYEKIPLVSLKDAVVPLLSIVHDVKRMVYIAIAQQNYQTPLDGLLPDEAASITLYTMECEPKETSLYIILNKTLRDENRDLLKPWLLYMKLFITALSKIPSKRLCVHRGINRNHSADYSAGETIVWWGFSSCTSSLHVLEKDEFLGKTGTRTLFTIDCHSGKNIRHYSMVKGEDEILLIAARQFKVMSTMDSGHGLHIIHLQEIDSIDPLLVSVSPKKTQISPSYHNARIEQIIHNCQSHKINLSGQRLNDQDMEIVVEQGIVEKQCISLDLMNTEITQRSISILVDALRMNTCLEELNISHNGILDSGVRLLASVINSSVLKRVDLEENDLSDEGVKYLAAMLKTNTKMLRLSLSVNQITDDGVTILANVLACDNTHLEVLNLSANTAVTDISLDSFVNMIEHNRTLKKLDLRCCDLSDDGKARLRTVARARRGFDLWL